MVGAFGFAGFIDGGNPRRFRDAFHHQQRRQNNSDLNRQREVRQHRERKRRDKHGGIAEGPPSQSRELFPRHHPIGGHHKNRTQRGQRDMPQQRGRGEQAREQQHRM